MYSKPQNIVSDGSVMGCGDLRNSFGEITGFRRPKLRISLTGSHQGHKGTLKEVPGKKRSYAVAARWIDGP